MQYTLDKNNYRDFRVIKKNRLPRRSYFIPFPDRKTAAGTSPDERRYASPKVLCLNGDWDFAFYPKPALLPDVLDTAHIAWETMPVPGCWQMHGIDRPFYVNTRYQFPYDPPRIPEEEKVGKVFSMMGNGKMGPHWTDPGEEYNFIGVYRRHFQITDLSKRYEIAFLGVCSCLDLYVNGTFVGYSEGSHNTAEFDLTALLHEGENELLCVVHRWCNGTYLECQDMFRHNGIFRDVLLRVTNPVDIRDISLHTKKENGRYELAMSVQVYTDTLAKTAKDAANITVSLELDGERLEQTCPVQGDRAGFLLADLDVREWNAEDPVLYDLYVETEGSCVPLRIGFRTVEIDGRRFLLNGRPLKLKGVNHHDSSPAGGFTMTPEEQRQDIARCKEFNINTIRTSHYPPDPYLLELCDEAGIYVVDEADIETHGTVSQQLKPSYNSISHDTAWRDHYMDRVRALYQRDKLHPCILMWSLGNEAGGYANQDPMYAYLKAKSDLPVHYESVIHSKRRAYDVGSEMYATIAHVREVGQGKASVKELNDRPYFLCEYLHAMGVGPGGAEEYWQEIYAFDSLMGGCVWEMTDHAIAHADGSYTYGGDHGEWEHDGNFCVDGLFYPDRTPSTGAFVVRHLYRPIRIRRVAGDQFEIFNTTAFSDGSRYRIEARYSDGTVRELIPGPGPLSKETVSLPAASLVKSCAAAQRDAYIDFVTFDTKTGEEVSCEQVMLSPWLAGMPEKDENRPLDGVLSVQNGRPVISIPALAASCGEGFLEGFSPETGEPGRRMTASDPYTILFRASTDNDRNLLGQDLMKPFQEMSDETLSVEYPREGQIRVKSRIKTGAGTFIATDLYQCVAEGILVTSHLQPEKGGLLDRLRPAKNLPRFGKAFVLDESFDEVRYLARCGESYNDMESQFPVRDICCRVEDMTEPNIRPQESGNRRDCRFVTLSDSTWEVTFTAIDRPFELGVKPYTDRALCAMKHQSDEVRTGTYVTLSGLMQGIGTGSCGPGTLPAYCYPADRTYSMQFLISAAKCKPD